MRRTITSLLITLAVTAGTTSIAHAADPSKIFFPVQVTEDLSYPDTWGDARGGGRHHTGTDIMSHQMAQVYASASGSIFAYEGDCNVGERCHSFYLLLSGDDGRSYFYVHLNNDTPGRPNGCDSIGGVDGAFSPRLAEIWKQQGTLKGVRVERGEHIAYVGSSGNAGCGVDHVHYELWGGHGWGSPKANPHPWLTDAHAAGNYWGEDGAPPAPLATSRVAGADRIRTAIELSEQAFTTSQTVVIAPAFVYPEALVAAPLASVMNAPVLLTWDQQTDGRDLLDDAVAAEIERLGATYAVIIGAPDRLGPELEKQIADKTSISRTSMRRIQGEDRYELSREVAEEVLAAHGFAAQPAEPEPEDSPPIPPLETYRTAAADDGAKTISPILALGEHEVEDRGWPDALAASLLAAREQVPVLLTRADDLPAATAALLDDEHIGEVRIVGGPQAISPAVEAAVQDEHGKSTRRLAGATRYSTSQAIAAEYVAGGGIALDKLYVATGRNFPDALASGSALARMGRVLLLVDGNSTDGSPSTYGWARDHAGSIAEVVSVGGPVAVRDDVLTLLARYANWPR